MFYFKSCYYCSLNSTELVIYSNTSKAVGNRKKKLSARDFWCTDTHHYNSCLNAMYDDLI